MAVVARAAGHFRGTTRNAAVDPTPANVRAMVAAADHLLDEVARVGPTTVDEGSGFSMAHALSEAARYIFQNDLRGHFVGMEMTPARQLCILLARNYWRYTQNNWDEWRGQRNRIAREARSDQETRNLLVSLGPEPPTVQAAVMGGPYVRTFFDPAMGPIGRHRLAVLQQTFDELAPGWRESRGSGVRPADEAAGASPQPAAAGPRRRAPGPSPRGVTRAHGRNRRRRRRRRRRAVVAQARPVRRLRLAPRCLHAHRVRRDRLLLSSLRTPALRMPVLHVSVHKNPFDSRKKMNQIQFIGKWGRVRRARCGCTECAGGTRRRTTRPQSGSTARPSACSTPRASWRRWLR